MLVKQALVELLHFQMLRAQLQTANSRALRRKRAMHVQKLWERLMRNFVCAALTLGALMTLSDGPANAYGTRHAFCIQGDEYPGLSTCTFDTYAQCLATASGRSLICVANPYFIGESNDPRVLQNRNRPFPQGYIPYPPNPYLR
jgi:hypothetical protein